MGLVTELVRHSRDYDRQNIPNAAGGVSDSSPKTLATRMASVNGKNDGDCTTSMAPSSWKPTKALQHHYGAL